MAGPGFSKVFFTLGGAEANENALKIARLVTGRHQERRALSQLSRRVDGRARAHRRLAARAARAADSRRRPRPGLLLRSLPVRQDRSTRAIASARRTSATSCSSKGPKSIAAVFLEPVPGANGVLVPPPEYWPIVRAGVRRGRRAARRRRGAHGLWSHRQAVRLPALGRHARHHHRREGPRLGLRDDRRRDRPRARSRSTSTSTSSRAASRTTRIPTACAAALETLKVYEDDELYENAAALGPVLRRELDAIAARIAAEDVRALARPARCARNRGAARPLGRRSAKSSRRASCRCTSTASAAPRSSRRRSASRRPSS